MNSKISTFFILLLVASPGFAERQQVDETKAASPDGSVHINVVRGDLTIEGWGRQEIQVTGRLDEKTEEFVFDVRENNARIDVRIEDGGNGWWGGNNEPSDLTVRVPRGSNLDISVVSTDVTAEDIQGGLKVGSVSGDLNIENVNERIELRSVSGDIELKQATGRIKIKTVSGDIETNTIAGQSAYQTVSGEIEINNGGSELELESISGDIDINNTDYVSVRGHSVSGNVDVSGRMLPDSVVELDSISGSIRLNTGKNPNAKYDLETASGRIRNQLTSDKPHKPEHHGSKSLRFVTGDGSGQVNISTRSGDVTLDL